MRLTTKGRYAVMALADIASKQGEGLVALSDIAVRQGISLSYLEQLFAKLRKAGLVASTRGVSGGYELAGAPADIRIAHIIAAVDEEIKTTACDQASSVGCRGATGRCLTHDLWDELGRHIDIFLNAVTLEDIIEKRVLGMAAVNPPGGRARTDFMHDALEPALLDPVEAAE